MPQPTPRELARKLGHVPLLVVLAVFVGCSAAPVSVGTSSAARPAGQSTATSAAPTRASSDSTAVAAVEAEAAPAGEAIAVSRVVDGDTFEIFDGRTIRVLGIDSCEMITPGGQQAKSTAESLLAIGGPITMTAEPGVDTDRYGRLLRYVQLNGGRSDFGEEMVKDDHTGVSQGENDPSPEYVQRLYAADLVNAKNPPSGRDCGEPTPAVVAPAPAPAARPEPEPAPAPNPEPASVYYKNCSAARAAGAAPVYVGEPGYSRKLDRDGDGVGCE
jgi:micrococcal nuclease